MVTEVALDGCAIRSHVSEGREVCGRPAGLPEGRPGSAARRGPVHRRSELSRPALRCHGPQANGAWRGRRGWPALHPVGLWTKSCRKPMNAAHKLVAIALLMMATMTEALAEDLVLYGAGSLREAMAQIATSFGQAHGVTVATQFGPSGRMRDRIEKGEHVDVFTSADVGHARKLVDDARASVMAVFARNTVCLLSPAAFGATTETALDRLLAPGVRVEVLAAKDRSAWRLHRTSFRDCGATAPWQWRDLVGTRSCARYATRGATTEVRRHGRRCDPERPCRCQHRLLLRSRPLCAPAARREAH